MSTSMLQSKIYREGIGVFGGVIKVYIGIAFPVVIIQDEFQPLLETFEFFNF